MRMGSYDQADKDIKEAIKLDPTNGSLYDYAALIATRLKHYEEAIGLAQEAVKRNIEGSITSGYRVMGISYYALNDAQKSIENFSKAIEQQDELENHYLRGVVYDSIGKSQEALSDFAVAVKWDPDLQSAYKRMAVIYTRTGQKSKATAILAVARVRLKSKLTRATLDWVPLDLSDEQMRALIKNPKASI